MKYVLELETVFSHRDDVKIISDIFNPRFVVEADSAEEAEAKFFEVLTLAHLPELADDDEIKKFHKVEKIEAETVREVREMCEKRESQSSNSATVSEGQ